MSDINENIKKNFKTREFRNTLINTLSSLLTDICKENDVSPLYNNERIIPFLTQRNNQSLTIKKYLENLVKVTQIESSTLIAMLIYIDRLCEINNFIINSFNVYRIIFSSFVIAIKYNEEKYFDNKFFSKLAGMSLTEMNLLESIYLNLIDYKLYISDEEFFIYCENIHDTINCMFCYN
jgi:hypothetical protein